MTAPDGPLPHEPRPSPDAPLSARPPAAFFRAHEQRLREAGRRGPLVDLACGRGRNAVAAARLGIPTIGIDRNAGFLRELGESAAGRGQTIECVRANLETRHGIPLRPGSCAAALVFRFLYRPLCPHIEALLQPGGWLLYETFRTAQATLPGGPSRAEFLLEDGELPKLFPALEIHSFEESTSGGARPEAIARLLARRPDPAS